MKMFSAHVHPALTQRVSEQHLCSFEVRNELLKKVLMAFHLQFWKKTVALYSALWFDHSLHTSDVMILFLTTGQSKALYFLINASYEERQMVLSAQVRTLQDRNPISYLWLFFFFFPQSRYWLFLDYQVSDGSLYLLKTLYCYRPYSYFSWAMSNKLFWQICQACLMLHRTHSSSHCLMISDFHPSSSGSLCSAN